MDYDHFHDKLTIRSITEVIIFVDRTTVLYSIKRQGSIETYTYGSELCAIKTIVEEKISVRYLIPCFGVRVEHTSLICGYNLGVVHNTTMKCILLKKKHVAM